MRSEPAPAEEILWWKLRNRRLGGFKFRRQQPAGTFVTDFYCAECKLVVELDGDSHDGREGYDANRTAELAVNGAEVIRFVNNDVYRNLDAVLEAILTACERHRASPSPGALPPSPLCGRGQG
jgi:very-short-patch-repair endonuclease